MKSLQEQATNMDLRAEEQLEAITRNEQVSWLQHPLTQWFLMRLTAEELSIVADWADGSFVHQEGDADATAQLNARELGRCQAYGDMRDWISSLSATADDNPGDTDDD